VLERTKRKNRIEVTFVLPADAPHREVSVVGDFNDWQPGAHPLAARPDGTRAVTVTLPSKARTGFRYLAEGGHWFDEEHADEHDGRNGYVLT
jgi:1,4-alpha-glucan branching enzyme